MNEEKKLTDEEIVKALDCCTKDDCFDCPYKVRKIDCVKRKRSEKDTLDLIHRLQGTIAEYERKLEDGELVSKEWHDEQVLHDKEEIERLKASSKFIVTKGGRNYGKIAHFKIVDYDRLKAENAELQKQVDELKKSQVMHIHVDEQFKKECEYEIKQAVKDTAKDLLIEFNEWINENYDAKFNAYCVCIPVDKASEFLMHKLKEYGVAVE